MVESVCGQREFSIDENHALVEFSIPLHGNGLYSPNMNCEWIISVPEYNIIDIKFENLDLQGPDDKGMCPFDYLEIADEDVTFYKF